MKNFKRFFSEYIFVFSIIILSAFLLVTFQNCNSPLQFREVELSSTELASLSLQRFTTEEDTPLEVQPKTYSSLRNNKALFTITRQPTHGTLTTFNSQTGKFTYVPANKYFGEDDFEYVEQEAGKSKPHQVSISIDVLMNNLLPNIVTDTIGFEMNTADTAFLLVVADYHDTSPLAFLSLDTTIKQIATKNGILKYLGPNKFSYMPNTNYRGNDSYEFVVKNSFGKTNKKIVYLNVGNPFRDLEPAIAVRGTGCAVCHLSTGSKLITDFGAGDSYFFGKQALATGGSPFSPPYSYYSDHGAGAWLTASLKEVLIPDLNLPFKPSSYDFTMSSIAQKAATTLPEYVNAVRGNATVTIKNQIYIGAPSSETIKSRTGLGTKPFLYAKNNDFSPDLAGLINKGSYYEATTLTCDGDLTINGPLFLNNLSLTTNEGCRIYTTGPIFISGKINYTQAQPTTTNNMNLQLVSSVWINLGVGTNHCENASNPGWYVDRSEDPISHRLITYPAATRELQQNGDTLRSLAQSLSGFQDASCRVSTNGEKPREVHYERLLLNAPRIDSRYTGEFNGVIIAEVNLMSLSAFSFTFDPVFSRVPILPMLLPSDYLVVK